MDLVYISSIKPTNMPIKTKISKRTSYDSMSVTIKYPTGGKLKYTVNRSGETLEVAFSNDPISNSLQARAVAKWIESLKGNNTQRMDAIILHFGNYTSGSSAVEGLG